MSGNDIRSGPHEFKTLDGIVTTLTVLLGLDATLDVVSALEVVVEDAFFPDLGPAMEAGDSGAIVLGLASGLLALSYTLTYFATVIVYCVWIHGANRNARALGAEGMTTTPGWAVGWWFIPFANLVRPYRAVREIYRASDPTAGATGWTHSSGTRLLEYWWAAWLVSNVFGQIEFRLSLRDNADLQKASAWVGVFGAPVAVASAVLALVIVRRIQARQTEKHRLLASGSALATPGAS